MKCVKPHYKLEIRFFFYKTLLKKSLKITYGYEMNILLKFTKFYHVLSLTWCLLLSLKYLFNFRDESASATFYFREHTEPGTKRHPSCDIAKPVSDNLEEVWMYYRPLKPGENEFPLRNKQVRKFQYSSNISNTVFLC